MTETAITAIDGGHAIGDFAHGAQSLIVGHCLRRIRPDIAERHRPKAMRDRSALGLDIDYDIQNRDAVKCHAAEFDRRAIAEVLVRRANVSDANVGVHGYPRGLS